MSIFYSLWRRLDWWITANKLSVKSIVRNNNLVRYVMLRLIRDHSFVKNAIIYLDKSNKFNRCHFELKD